MGFRNFRFQIVLRVVGITGSSIGLAWSIFETDFLMTPIVFGLLTLIQLVALIYYSEWTIRELKRFFDSFIDSDYTRRFEKGEKGRVFDELGSTFNLIVDDFKRIRIEKEEHYQYLLQVNNHISVGLICFSDDGRIDLMNTAACELLNRPQLNEMRMIKNSDPLFFDRITTLDSGEKTLYKYGTGQRMDLAITANKFKLGDKNYTLLSLQNIRAELDAQEMQAWQKLIRVLTHEIMNSVTPVVSLTTAVKKIMEDESGDPISFSSLENEQGDDIYRSINAIEKRGKGLLDFVNAYRDYTKVPNPDLSPVDLVEHVNEVVLVMSSILDGVDLKVEKDAETIVHPIDRTLIDQVLINLLKNAAEALHSSENPTIRLRIQSNGPILSIADNGPGIPEEIWDEIFVPFYTTKEKGNGIGLSLSKQIMKAHGGDLTFRTDENGSVFNISFESLVTKP